MNRFILAFILLNLVVLIAGGCGESAVNTQLTDQALENAEQQFHIDEYSAKDSSAPSDVVANYFFALQEGRISDARTCLSKTAHGYLTDEKLISSGLELERSRKNFRIFKEDINGNRSTVTYMFNMIADDSIEEKTASLVMESGRWKIYDLSVNVPK